MYQTTTTTTTTTAHVKFSLRFKLMLSFGIIIVLLLIQTGISLYLQADSQRLLTNVLDHETRLHTIESLNYAVRSVDDDGAWFIMSGGNPVDNAHYQSDVANVASSYASLLSQTPNTDSASLNRLHQFQQHWKVYLSGNSQAFAQLASGKKIVAEANYVSVPFTPVIAPLTGYTQYLQTDEQKLIQGMNANQSTTSLINWIVVVIVIAVSLVIALILSRQIGQAVKQVQVAMRKLANKDLRIDTLPAMTQDELGELAINVNDTITALQKVITQIRHSAEEVSSASEETAASTEETANALTEVANQMQQLNEEAQAGQSSSMEVSKALLELSSLIQIAQQQATTAIGQAETTQQAAATGLQTVESTLHRMEEIQRTSKTTEVKMDTLQKYSLEIGAIAQTIREIADQTNLLALNASIEAARAGEQGRGFAVVAEEVRKLAEQAHQESGRVSEVLSRVSQVIKESVDATHDSLHTIEEGVNQATQAGTALTSIDQAVRATTENIHRIYQVTKDEVANSEKIVALIHTVSTVIENTASHAENVAAASEEMSAAMQTIAAGGQLSSSQAVLLSEQVAEFQLP